MQAGLGRRRWASSFDAQAKQQQRASLAQAALGRCRRATLSGGGGGPRAVMSGGSGGVTRCCRLRGQGSARR